MSGERDVPSVPVTTLAGLTSISDLLSELPLSDSLSNVSTQNKSLLFHTLVANESNNLLSMRDENLVKQLVNAIEQTNSDNIELKPQFAVQQHGTNISAHPELLQGIYNYRPTVFNTPQKANHQQQIPTQPHLSHHYASPQQHLMNQSDLSSIQQQQPNLMAMNDGHLLQSPLEQKSERDMGIMSTSAVISDGDSSVGVVQQQMPQIADQQLQLDIGFAQQQLQAQNAPQPSGRRTRRQLQQQLQQQQNLELTTPMMAANNQQIVQQQSVLYQQPQQISTVVLQQQNLPHQHSLSPHNQQHLQPEQYNNTTNFLMTEPAAKPNHFYQQPNQQQQLHQAMTAIQSPESQVMPTIQGNFQNVLNLQRQHLQQQQLAMQQQHQKDKLPIAPAPINYNMAAGAAPIPESFNNTSIGGISSIEASTATAMNETATFHAANYSFNNSNASNNNNLPNSAGSSSNSSRSDKSLVRSPEIAKNVGISVNDNTTTTQMPAITTATKGSADTFSIMKEDEKRYGGGTGGTKRKLPMPLEDIPAEQIYTKPKVRRVERVLPQPVLKCSREEVIRSQTYQQFMRNMEQIIELLDDTDTPNFESDEVDENVECISSKMLHTMSSDVAKLKAKSVLDTIPKNKLTLLINYAMRNIYLAKNYSASPDDEEEIVDDEVMEKILNGIEACLLICNIYSTAKDLKFLQEDNISLIIKFVQFQFRETIFPSYDPVYTVKSMKKSASESRKRTKAQHLHHSRNLNLLYSKAVELMKVLVTLFDKCIFVDTIVLPLSTLAVEPFFVDNIETLQFVCLELVTTIFRKERYEKIRSSILNDILSSIDRLPSSKKNLRPFKLTNNSGSIQMVTALVLQLIQCATILPESLCQTNSRGATDQSTDLEDEVPGGVAKIGKQNHDVTVLKKYDVAISIGGNFLTTFLNKCKSRTNETDFRPLFENFIHDLLATVNKPEWPASELLLSLLGTMLVRYVSDKSIEQSIRLVSLDYLGIVAARLRKDTVESRCKVNIIDSMIKSIKAEQEKEGDLPIVNNKIELDADEERTEFLQKILLDFLAVNAQEENMIWDYARHFYLVQWYRDIIYQRRRITEGDNKYASRKKKQIKKKRKRGSSSCSSDSNSSDDSDDHEDDDGLPSTAAKQRKGNRNSVLTDQQLNLEIFQLLEERKKYLLNNIKMFSTDTNLHTSQHIKTYIDYTNANLIAQYLATKRPFSQSFDGYLKKIILVVNEPSIAVRTRAMKCLANIVEVDPMVLKRKDMQMGVNQKFLDAAISVREAAVDLVGKFVLSNEELIDQYYDMLSTRILDTGVSVRKRVIKILRDICIEYPDFSKIPEICVKMIRRVHDEEGIQKLVTDVFMKMWFQPCRKDDKHGVQRKINQIIDVVNTAHDTGTAWLEGLLNSIFQPKENMLKLDGTAQEPVKKNTEPPAEIVLACQQLADGLVARLIELEDTDNDRMLGCITTLHLLAKVRPQLLVHHAMTIEPYLNIKCHPSTAPKFICSVADILEKVVPLVNNASETFLASLEEHLMLLVVSLNQAVVTSCVSCLGALVNKITKNYKLIRDCFQKFYRVLDHSRSQVMQGNHSIESIYTPMFRRSLFTIGILMRYFDFKTPEVLGEGSVLPANICDETFYCLLFFVQCSNIEIRKQALIAMGSFCVMNDEYLIKSELRRFYCDLLAADKCEASIKIICMRNIWIYLTESEMYMHNKEKEWEKQAKHEDLKEMNDVSSGMASRIIQLYLQEILDCFLHPDENVRLWAVKVVQIVLRQGLVHPVRMVPYLICLSTDCKLEAAHRADSLLKDIDKTYSGFVNMKVQFGLQLCFQLQEKLQMNNKGRNSGIIRGYIKRDADTMPSALNDFLYTLLRTTKPQRRALVLTVVKQFDDQKMSLRQMLYIADNLAYFPYVVQDEPLYLIHQIDLLISMAGTNLLATFKECLKPSENVADVLEDDDDEEDPEVLLKRLPDDTTEIQKCITSAQACMLLLILKDHLKDMYGLTDGKIARYSPSEPKIYEKAVARKVVADFHPKSTMEVIKKQHDHLLSSGCQMKTQLTHEERLDIVVKYLDFKKLMLKLDPEDAESDEEARDKSKLNNNSVTAGADTTATTSFMNTSTTSSGHDTSLNNSGFLNNSMNASTYTAAVAAANMMRDPSTTHMTPSTRASRFASNSQQAAKSMTPSKKVGQQQRSGRRKKRRMITSDDEDDDDDYSDDGYA